MVPYMVLLGRHLREVGRALQITHMAAASSEAYSAMADLTSWGFGRRWHTASLTVSSSSITPRCGSDVLNHAVSCKLRAPWVLTGTQLLVSEAVDLTSCLQDLSETWAGMDQPSMAPSGSSSSSGGTNNSEGSSAGSSNSPVTSSCTSSNRDSSSTASASIAGISSSSSSSSSSSTGRLQGPSGQCICSAGLPGSVSSTCKACGEQVISEDTSTSRTDQDSRQPQADAAAAGNVVQLNITSRVFAQPCKCDQQHQQQQQAEQLREASTAEDPSLWRLLPTSVPYGALEAAAGAAAQAQAAVSVTQLSALITHVAKHISTLTDGAGGCAGAGAAAASEGMIASRHSSVPGSVAQGDCNCKQCYMNNVVFDTILSLPDIGVCSMSNSSTIGSDSASGDGSSRDGSSNTSSIGNSSSGTVPLQVGSGRSAEEPCSACGFKASSDWSACSSATTPAECLRSFLAADIWQQVCQQLQEVGTALCNALPVPWLCNNPGCTNMAGASELQLIGGRSCVCWGCRVAR